MFFDVLIFGLILAVLVLLKICVELCRENEHLRARLETRQQGSLNSFQDEE